MKKLIAISLIAVSTSYVFAQGNVTFLTGNANPVTYLRAYTLVNGVETLVGTVGSQAPYYVGLYYGLTADPAAMHLAEGISATTAPAGSGLARFASNASGALGYLTTAAGLGGGIRTLPDAGIAGQTVYFQVRAWSDAFTSYEAAIASGDGNVLAGVGPIKTAVPSTTVPPAPTPPTILWGGTSASPVHLQLVPVPEPSTLALVGLGLMGLIFIRRRN